MFRWAHHFFCAFCTWWQEECEPRFQSRPTLDRHSLTVSQSPPSVKERVSLRYWHHKLRNAAFTWAVLFGMKKNVSSLSSESHIPHSLSHTHTHLKSKACKTPTHKSNVQIKTLAVMKIYSFIVDVQDRAKHSGRSAVITNGGRVCDFNPCCSKINKRSNLGSPLNVFNSVL